MTVRAADRQRSGWVFGIGAYGMWGLFPAFFPLLKPAGAVEILAHRIVWSAAFLAIVIVAVRRVVDLRAIATRTWGLLAIASVLIAANWAIYVYAVNNGHVVDAALGYFINPLVTVLLGLMVFGERLAGAQWVALAVAVGGVAVLTWQVGAPPYIGLGLALTFALYGAVKKVVPVDPRVSVGVEAGLATPFALGYLGFLQHDGSGTFIGFGAGHSVLLIVAGILTALPLLLFAAAAQRLALVTMGLLFYLTPVMQLSWGIAVGGEPMPPARWAGFALIWVALALFTVDSVLRSRARLNLERGALRSPPTAPDDRDGTS